MKLVEGTLILSGAKVKAVAPCSFSKVKAIVPTMLPTNQPPFNYMYTKQYLSACTPAQQ